MDWLGKESSRTQAGGTGGWEVTKLTYNQAGLANTKAEEGTGRSVQKLNG